MQSSRKITAQNGKAYSYIRCSTPGQSKEGKYSIVRQKTGAEDYCKEFGLTLMGEGYDDIGVSAYRNKNATGKDSQLFALLEAIKAGAISKGSTLIIENLDRLSRAAITDSLPMFLQLINDDIYVVTLTDKMVWSKEAIREYPERLFFSIFSLTRANKESERKAGLIQDAWIRDQLAASKGEKKIKQNYPKWLELKSQKFILIPDRVAVIKSIFKQYLDGAGTGLIARTLNEKGIKSFTGKDWNQTLVKHYLKFPAVHGEWRAHKRDEDDRSIKVKTELMNPNYYPAIIPKSDFDRVRARMATHKPKHGRPQRADANLFSGIIECGYCGKSMGIYNAKESSSFICWNSLAGGCVRVAFPSEAIEIEVLGSLYTVMGDWAAAKTDTKKVEELRGQLIEVDDKIRNLVKVIEAGGDLTPVTDRLKVIKGERQALDDELQQQLAMNETVTSPNAFKKWINKLQDGSLTADDRISIIPHIKRHIKCIKVFSAGDAARKANYEKALMQHKKEGKNGSQVYHILRKKFRTWVHRYFTLELLLPVKLDGKMVTEITPRKFPNFLQASPKGGLMTGTLELGSIERLQ